MQSAADYKQENDAARLTAKPEPIPVTIETFTIELADVKGASATLNFVWDKTRVPVKLTTGDVEQVSKQLDTVINSRTLLYRRTAYQVAVQNHHDPEILVAQLSALWKIQICMKRFTKIVCSIVAAMICASALAADQPSCKKTGKNCPMNNGKACNCGKSCDC